MKHLLLAVVGALFLLGCATTPKTVRLADNVDSCGCDLQNDPFESLLASSLDDSDPAHASHALSHFVERWHQLRRDERSADIGEAYRITFTSSRSRYPLDYFDSIAPAGDYRVAKLEHRRRDGVGAAMVGLRENTGREPIEQFYPPEAITRPVTAVITKVRRQGGVQHLTIELVCPFETDRVVLDGESVPIAVDTSVPWARLLERTGGLKTKQLFAFANLSARRETRLYLMEPYDAEKEPLIMVHGLLGTPLDWAELTNTLWAEDAIRSRYQIWHYLYDTAAPAIYSGRQLREQLREVRQLLDPHGRDPAMQSTTIIAHSMGAIVTRCLLTEPKNAFWEAAFTRPFDSLELSDDDRASLKDAFFWKSQPHVKRVIYVAPSHLGSDFADNLIGRFGRWAARPPKSGFADFYHRVSEANPGAFTEAYAQLGRGELDSISALSPRQPSLPILAGLPNAHPVREFSIIGNEGKPGPLEDSSDGIVPYWSSHIDRAESELIVPSGHYAFYHPEAVEEITRILNLP